MDRLSHACRAVYDGSPTIVKLNREDAQDPSQHDVVQPGLIGECVNDIGKDMIIEDVATDRDEHEVTAPLVVV
jgi:hypothetical protein